MQLVCTRCGQAIESEEARLNLECSSCYPDAVNGKLQILAKHYWGSSFGEHVLYHYNRGTLEENVSDILGVLRRLPTDAADLAEEWLHYVSALGSSVLFWRAETGRVFVSLCKEATLFLAEEEICPSEDDIINMFRLAVLNLALYAHRHPQSRNFILNSIGPGQPERLIA
jgi:hypothetical protein